MDHRRSLQSLPPLPFDTAKWATLQKRLKLPPQQARVAELVLRGLRDKQIAELLGLKIPTVRTYLSRLFTRFRVGDRVELILHLVAAVNTL